MRQNVQDVARAQSLLNSLGYDAGPVDGVFGRKTRDAMNRFQRDYGLPLTPTVTRTVLQALTQAHQSAGQNGPIVTQPHVPPVGAPSQEFAQPPAATVPPSGTPSQEFVPPPVATVPPAAKPGAGSSLQVLISPPDGIAPFKMTHVDGIPALSDGTTLGNLIELIVLGYRPNLLERYECAIIRQFFKEESLKKYARPYECSNSRMAWQGADEFASLDMRNHFYATEIPKLLSITPKLPVTIAVIDYVRLGQFAAENSSFPVGSGNGLLETLMDQGGSISSLNFNVTRNGPTRAATNSIPEMWLPMASASHARDFLAMVNSWEVPSDYGFGPVKTGQRMMRRVGVVELTAYDVTTHRLDLQLKSLWLYDIKLSRKFYDFPVEAPMGSVVTGGGVDALMVPEPVALDRTYLLLRQIQQFGEDTPSDFWKDLAGIIGGRDSYFYGMQRRDPQSAPTYDPKDVRRPFFPNGDYNMPDNRWPLFRSWVKILHRRSAG